MVKPFPIPPVVSLWQTTSLLKHPLPTGFNLRKIKGFEIGTMHSMMRANSTKIQRSETGPFQGQGAFFGGPKFP